ncbi:MAG TPA: HAD family hydrolase [Burkholderiaceae bacterium]|jgi:HAD superfamily hydrolase (TIGR01490 family)|nr:HAD family hydrolase [Burkholderiaceae bacterium]
MRLALFDLDHTLLPIDSADAWSHFVVRAGGLDPETHAAQIRRFAEEYRCGSFDPEEYLAFQMGLLARFALARLEKIRSDFVEEVIEPNLRPEAFELIDSHRRRQHELVLVTGTNSFVTAPIAERLGLPHLLAVRPEQIGGRFTGGYVGHHTYGYGKVVAVERFLAERGSTIETLEQCAFYSDSINDVPLLERVAAGGGQAVVTNADQPLRALAQQRGWPVLDLFATALRFGETAPDRH